MLIKIKYWIEKFIEPWTACMLCMVQGDLSVITLQHAITAGKTGVIAATVLTLTPFNNKIINYWLLGLATMGADFITHPTHFGLVWTEALVTGIIAVALAIAYDTIRNKKIVK